MQPLSQGEIHTPMFVAALFTSQDINNLNVHWRMNGYVYTMVYIHDGILTTLKKEGNPAICDNKEGTWGHYVK